MEQDNSTKTTTFVINNVSFNGVIIKDLDKVLNGLYTGSGSGNSNN